MKAGFDLSDMEVVKWQEMLNEFNLDTVTRTDKGWIWTDSNSRNFVVTANNPINGEYYNGMRDPETGYLSYVGIEGDTDFVTDFFQTFKENADYIKDEEFGDRGYI